MLTKRTQSGNAIVIVLVVLVIAAVGALAYISMGKKSGETPPPAEVASAESPASTEAPMEGEVATEEDKQIEIKPGNPVVAKLGAEEITRQEVVGFMQKMPSQMQQLPIEQLFPIAMEQVINTKIVEEKAKSVNLDQDPEVKKQMELAKEQIVRTVFIQNKINEKLTDDRLQKAYDDYVAKFKKEEEVKASHILVDDEAKAREIIAKLIETGDFSTLAKENSKDATAANGGDLGYFLKGDVVPEFAEAAFAMEPGTYTKDPVKTQFGYHIIRVEDKRIREPAPLDQVKQFLEADLRRQILDEVLQAWRDDMDIERFNINGEKVEPAAGDE